LDQVGSPISRNALGKSSQSVNAHFSKPALDLAKRYEIDLDLFKDFQFVTTEDVKAKLDSIAQKVEHGRLFSEFKAVALVGGGMGAEVLLERLQLSSQSDKVGGYFDVNKRIVDLSNPMITEEGKELVQLYYRETIDPEGRGSKNLIRMMTDDGFFKFLPKTDEAFLNFVKPFTKLTRKEKRKFKQSN
jgi:hypothetical protein